MKTRNDNHLQMANQESNINHGGDKMNLKIFNSKRLKIPFSIVTLLVLLWAIPTPPSLLTGHQLSTETPKVNSKNPFKPDQFKDFSGKQARDLAELIGLASDRFEQQKDPDNKKSADKISKMLPDGYAFIQNLTDKRGNLFGFVAQKNRKEEGEEKREAFIIIRGTMTLREAWKVLINFHWNQSNSTVS